MAPIILYDVYTPSGRPVSPNPWITRLSLVFKRVPFVVKHLTFTELRDRGPGTLHDRLKSTFVSPSDRPLIPTIEVPADGQVDDTLWPGGVDEGCGQGILIGDTITIAEYLDAAFPPPRYPSLFIPHATKPLSVRDPEYLVAHQTARLLKEGIGNSDSQWSAFFEIVNNELSALYEPIDRNYMRSDAKLGIRDGHKIIQSMDRVEMLAHSRRSLLPFSTLLSPSATPRITAQADTLLSLRPAPASRHYLSGAIGDQPGLIDMILFARFILVACGEPTLLEPIFAEDSAASVEWVRKERHRTGSDSNQAWLGDVKVPGIWQWAQRMLDLGDGYTRKAISGEQKV